MRGWGLISVSVPPFSTLGVAMVALASLRMYRPLPARLVEAGTQLQIIEQVHEVNELQKLRPYQKAKQYLQDLRGKRIAVWGLAFKPETDDMRQAPSIVVIEKLIEAGAEVSAFDPIAMDNARTILPPSVEYGTSIYETAMGADAIILLTEWKQLDCPIGR